MIRLLPALLVLCSLTAPAAAQDWRVDFGPYLGYYDFDEITQFEDGGMFGFRLGVHRGGWFRFEAEFDEVYTSRKPRGNAARQATLAIHGRLEPSAWTIAPSIFAGMGLVMFDDSDQPDAFGDGYDIGLGLAWRFTNSWRLTADYMARYQQLKVRNPDLPPDHPDAGGSPRDLWASSIRVGARYEFPSERNDEPAHYPIELGAYMGFWNFSNTVRYQDDAVLGLRAGVGITDWLGIQVELDQITTSNQRTGEWAQAVSFAMHGVIERRMSTGLRPGMLFGVAFTGLDNNGDEDAVSEGFDIGPSLRYSIDAAVLLQLDGLFRYQSVKVNGESAEGSEEVDYVWSGGLRLGVAVAF